MILYLASGQIVYASISGVQAVSLCFYILPPSTQPIMIDLVSGWIAYASLFGLLVYASTFRFRAGSYYTR